MIEQEIIIAAEGAAKAPVKRFVRNNDAPLELEVMRERIVSARVMNGLTAVEASHRLGYKNSTQLSQIESGERKVPSDWQFIKRMAAAYSVSIDYLMGLSPHPERDAVAAESFAILRGFEQLQQAQAAAMTTAFIKFGTEREAARIDLQSACASMDTVIDAMATVRRLCPEFDEDVRGGNKLMQAVSRLEATAIPLRDALKRRALVEKHALAIARGKEGPLSSYVDDSQSSLDLE
jgi:transcriptional regulator with XRE-family HTH domain